jgi:O-antigen/teichoic acid export membrane protein
MLGVSILAGSLQQFFQSETMWMYVIFAMSIPLYFLMSIGRGYVQGIRSFTKLSMSYQLEMLIRLCGTVALLRLLDVEPGISISLGILASVALGNLPIRNTTLDRAKGSFNITKTLWVFAMYTLVYELSQVLINNTDILLVKHYFSAEEAGLYAALAMIGRVVFFIAWMFAMILLPHVIAAEKAGKDSKVLLWKYVGYTSVLGATITGASYLMPDLIVQILFGSAYMEIAPLLWLYALATSLFAVANMFAYYFLSRSTYGPIYLTFIVGFLQVIGLIAFHETLYQVVILQVVLMAMLLVAQVGHYIHYCKTSSVSGSIDTELPLIDSELPLTEDNQ